MSFMAEIIDELWWLKRDIVSDDFDRALYRLAEDVPMEIHEFPSGRQCWTWNVPEKWTCHEAYLETLGGQRLLDYHGEGPISHPLHVVSYSLPFEGVVSKDELLEHLHVHPIHADAIPFVFKYYERDWGLCATEKLRDSLTDEAYRVVIRTSFEPGSLKVGEIVIPGESEKTFVIVAHLCHPAMVNDDLSGVVVGLDVARNLLDRTTTAQVELNGNKDSLYYTYRILILPETIGSVAYLSHNENLIPDMIGGLFLEMLGNDSVHALQTSFSPNSQVDRCLTTALPDLDARSYQGAYRTIIDNDERQFNAPGVRVPMLSLSRVEAPKSSGLPPYPEYHSSLDTPAIVSQRRLEESRDVILSLVEAWENNQYVVNNFKGEIFCSGYGIWIDHQTNPEGHKRLFEIMERCDGEHTVADIAVSLNISYQAVWEVVEKLRDKGLVWLSRTPSPTAPAPR